MTKIVLLDIDGVLVSHGGYRAALHSTLNHYASLMGLDHFDFPEEKLAELEKRGIFSEWDMVPLLLGTLWNDILAHYPNINLPADLSSAAAEIGKHINGYLPRELHVPEFEFTAGQYPAEAALQQTPPGNGCRARIKSSVHPVCLCSAAVRHHGFLTPKCRSPLFSKMCSRFFSRTFIASNQSRPNLKRLNSVP